MAEPTEGGPPADENRRLRELLGRWLEMERKVLPPDELARLCEDTRRALGAAGPTDEEPPPPT